MWYIRTRVASEYSRRAAVQSCGRPRLVEAGWNIETARRKGCDDRAEVTGHLVTGHFCDDRPEVRAREKREESRMGGGGIEQKTRRVVYLLSPSLASQPIASCLPSLSRRIRGCTRRCPTRRASSTSSPPPPRPSAASTSGSRSWWPAPPPVRICPLRTSFRNSPLIPNAHAQARA